MGLAAYLFAALAFVAVRPLAIAVALLGSTTTWQERLVAGWFGPKGFASIFYGLLIWQADVPDAERLFHLVALSIVAHSSTDVVLARWIQGSRQGSSGEQAAAAE